MDPNIEGGAPAVQQEANQAPTTPTPENNPAPTGDVPAAEGQAPTGDAPSRNDPTEFAVPEEYGEKAWAKGIKSVDDLYKHITAQDALIGKKNLPIDFATATPQEIEDHYKASRPENVGDYAFAEGVDPSEQDAVSKMLHDNGISKHQGDNVIKQYQEMTQGITEESFGEKGFLDGLKARYGEDGFEKMAAQGEQTVRANLNEADRKMLDSLPNNAIDVVYALANNMVKAYGANESGVNGNNPAPTGGTPVDKKAEGSAIRKEMAEMSKRPHTAQEKATLQSRLDALYR